MSNQSGLVLRQAPTDVEIEAIQKLIAVSDEHDYLHTRLSLDMLRNRSGYELNDFLFYEQGLLVGYIAIDNFGTVEKELVGLVHPDYRRRGIFRTLLKAAVAECKTRGVQRLQFVCEHTSVSGQAVMHKLGATLDHAEYEMELQAYQPRISFDDRLIFREASMSDIDAIVKVMDSEFERDEEAALQFVAKVFQMPREHYYLATFGSRDLGCHEPVGVLRLWEADPATIGIYGFVVRPEYRGMGYGRQMLQESIDIIRERGQRRIMLDVDTDNTNAIGLYRSVGFVVVTTYDYYNLEI